MKRFTSSAYKPYKFISKAEYSELSNLKTDEVFIVIAAFNFLDIETDIRNLGYRDYAIYVYNRDWLLLPNIGFSKQLYSAEKSEDV